MTNWSLNDRILHWSENLIRLFGLGLKWEYFDSYAKGLPVPTPNHGDYTYYPEVKRRQVISARLFFQDLLSLVTHDSLSEEGKRLYCMVARNLLTSIWARLGNRSYSYEGAYSSATPYVGKQIYSYGYQMDADRTPYMTEGETSISSSPEVRNGGSLIEPSKEQRNLAFNSYSVMCLENKNTLDEQYSNFNFKWDKSRFEKPYARFHELTALYTNLILRKWPIRDVTTPYDYETSGKWGRETAFRVPESYDEEWKRINEDYNTH